MEYLGAEIYELVLSVNEDKRRIPVVFIQHKTAEKSNIFVDIPSFDFVQSIIQQENK